MTSTPYHWPSSPAWLCFCLSLFRTSVESIPELSLRVFGITSSAFANEFRTSYCLPETPLRYSLRNLESSISMAPPPATTEYARMALLTIIIASFKDLSASSMYWSAPPLRTIVQDLVPTHSVNKLYLSEPSWTSSKTPQVPRISSVSPFTVVWMTPVVDFATLFKSSWGTLPAQKRPLSAKYWVAKSPMGSLERIIWAPDLTILSNLS
mmetsp:Transcript_20316/g.19254  ORF Transcript_20316/g.19254 Transcript_20316/m.19254 type:complete len:209 (-) Transcript_20316:781-1407(-)